MPLGFARLPGAGLLGPEAGLAQGRNMGYERTGEDPKTKPCCTKGVQNQVKEDKKNRPASVRITKIQPEIREPP